jgi:hypothetical protein
MIKRNHQQRKQPKKKHQLKTSSKKKQPKEIIHGVRILNQLLIC